MTPLATCFNPLGVIVRVIKVKVGAKFTLEQATKVQRKNRGIPLLFL
jgi:hypothetical protein